MLRFLSTHFLFFEVLEVLFKARVSIFIDKKTQKMHGVQTLDLLHFYIWLTLITDKFRFIKIQKFYTLFNDKPS